MTLRIFIAGTALTLYACGTPAPASPPPSASEANRPAVTATAQQSRRTGSILDIPARDQARERPKQGWCAETAIQESMLHFGGYTPQRDINRAGNPRHPDLYWDDVPTALDALGVAYTRWSGDGGLTAFSRWVREQLDAGHPIIAGVKIYPTDHPRWGLDHIVTIVGVDDSGAMSINTTWGYRVRRTRVQLESTDEGISLTNRYGRQFAYAVTGFEDRARQPTVRLELERETDAHIAGVVRVADLIEGRRYELRRVDETGAVVTSRRFEATASSGKFEVDLDPDQTARFELVASE